MKKEVLKDFKKLIEAAKKKQENQLSIPNFAKGANYKRGLNKVEETGPEVVVLPKGINLTIPKK